MKMLGEINDCESLEISQEKFYDEVSFGKVTNLQCSDWNFAIKRTHHSFFLEYKHPSGVYPSKFIKTYSITQVLHGSSF